MPSDAELTFGRKAVRELVERDPHRVRKLCVVHGARGAAVRELVALARAAGVRVQFVPRNALDRQAAGGVHQGVLAEVETTRTWNLPDLLAAVDAAPGALLVACDGVTDPHNLGAIARSAAAAGAAGMFLPVRGSAPLSAVARKAAAGALERLRVAKVPNLVPALQACRAAGWWVVGTGAEAEVSVYDADLTVPLVLVLGSEGKGLRPLVRKQCDLTVAVPLAGGTESLNVSVAAGVVLFEARRQRRAGATGR